MENKRITNTTKFFLCIWNIGLFAAIWFWFYDQLAFDKYWFYGGIASVGLYAVIYLFFCHIYHAFRIASTYIGDTIFGQVIAFGIADIILYVECCLMYNHYANVIPGAVTALVQIAGTSVIIALAKKLLMIYVRPKKTLLIYGNAVTRGMAEQFAGRLLEKYDHLFDICYMENEEIRESHLQELMGQSEAVLLYEVSGEKRENYMKLCTEEKKYFYFTPRIEDILCQGSSAKNLLDTPLLKYDYNYESVSGYLGKRFLDILLALIFLIILSPIFLIVAVCIKLEDRGPVFYKQKRCTKDEKIFEILKFRSMVVDAEKDGVTPCRGNDSRVTKVGKVIRAARMDELPQLINILKGDMSFVGPRPERIEHVMQYKKEIPEFTYRHRVKGGLTGYAQIFGKYNTSAYDKLRLDLMYIENQSLFLDLKILMLTFKIIFKAESTEGFDEEKSEEMNRKTKKLESME